MTTSHRSPGRRRALARLAALAAGALLAGGLLGAAPAAEVTAAPAADVAVAAPAAATGFVPGSQDDAGNARAAQELDRALRSGATGRAAPGNGVRTITYDPSGAPSFQREIRQAVQIWNSSLRRVHLAQGPRGRSDFSFTEGRDAQGGSYAATNFDGYGRIFLEYTQAEQYDPLRIVAHETGHILGLPDRYQQPCQQLMSGGGAGPSCHNPRPSATEAAQADRKMIATWNRWWGQGRAAAAS